MHFFGFFRFKTINVLGLAAAVGVSGLAPARQTPPLQTLGVPVLSAISQSTQTGAPSGSQILHVTISIPPRNQQALQIYADNVSDPKSPYHGRFITPVEIGQMFGAPSSEVNRLVAYLKGEGFQVKLVADSHFAVLADCTVAQAEAAFHTQIGNFHLTTPVPTGRSDYYANYKPLKAPKSLANLILTVSGLNNFAKPVPLHHMIHPAVRQGGGSTLTPTQTRVLYDLAPIYNAGLTGKGRHIGISNWDGFTLSNIPLWYAQYGLPTPAGGVLSNVNVVTIDGGSQFNGSAGEGDLDQQMVLGMAPLCTLTIYDGGGDPIDVWTQEAQDNLADVLTESYGWGSSDPNFYIAAHNLHLQMSAQGQTYMCASGDSGTSILPYSTVDPDITLVGGTEATVDSSGNRTNEVAWSLVDGQGGGSGWVTDSLPFNVLPSWQKGKGVPTNINFRLIPDVALHAFAPGDAAYYFFFGGQLSTVAGTSCASPTFAGALGVSEQKMITLGDIVATHGKYRLGRINNVLYKQDGLANVWHDITSGDTGPLPNGSESVCTPFWDTATGWGAIDFNGFVRTFTSTQHPVDVAASTVGVYDGQGASPEGGVGGLAGLAGSYYTESSMNSAQGQIDAAIVTFSLPESASNFASINLNLTENGPSGTTNFVYVFNYSTRNFDLISTTPNSGMDLNLSLTIANFTNYVSPSGEIQVVNRMVWPDRVGQPYVMKLNLAQIAAVPNG